MGKIRAKDLENGVLSPSTNQYYGTDGSWILGFHNIPWAAENSGVVGMKYGENIQAGKLVFFWDGEFKKVFREGNDVFDNRVIGDTEYLWYSADFQKYRMKFVRNDKYEFLNSIIIPIQKTSSASGRVWVKILKSNWELIKKSNEVDVAKIKEVQQVVFDFWNIKLEKGTYRIEIETNVNNTNQFLRIYCTASVNSYQTGLQGREMQVFKQSTWQDFSWDKNRWINLQMIYSMKTVSGEVYECDSSMMDTAIADGTTLEEKEKGQIGKIMIMWVNSSLSHLNSWARYRLNSDVSFDRRSCSTQKELGRNISNQKFADLFVCDFKKSFRYLYCPLQIVGGWGSNSLVVKIVEVDETTGLPSNNLANPNAVAKMPYKDLKAWEVHYYIFEFPAEVRLVANKKYYVLFEIEGNLNSGNYVNMNIWNNADSSMYVFKNSEWVNEAGKALCYSLMIGDDVNKTQALNQIVDANKRSVGATNNLKQGQRFVVSVPMKVKSMTFIGTKNQTPAKDLTVRIESNKRLSSKNNDNGFKNLSTIGTKTNVAFGTIQKKKQGMKIIGSQDIEVDNICLQIKRKNSPFDKITVRIETDNGGKPSGTLVSAKAKGTADLSSFSTNDVERWIIVNFEEKISLSKSTTYWIIIEKENEETSSTSYFELTAYEWDGYMGGELRYTTNNSTWSKEGGGKARLFFAFNNTFNETVDVPSGTLCSVWAKGIVKISDAKEEKSCYTVEFEQEVSLIPNTIYWMVFDAMGAYTEEQGYRFVRASQGQMYTALNELLMPSSCVSLSNNLQWKNNEKYLIRFWLNGIRETDGGFLNPSAWEFSGKDLIAIGETSGILSIGDAGVITKRKLDVITNKIGSQYVLVPSRDCKIQFLKDVSWSIKWYKQNSDYTEVVNQSWSAASIVNLKKDIIYSIANTGSLTQEFMLSI